VKSSPLQGTKWEFGCSPTWSPFVIVLFDADDLSDELLLQTLGVTVRPTPLHASGGSLLPYVAVANCNEWKAIGSDWSYALWHNQGTRTGLWKLAQDFRILAYSMGDTDYSYSFHLFDEGELIRESTGSNGQMKLLFDTGERLPGESLGELGPAGLAQNLASLAAANGFHPEAATDVHYWWIEQPTLGAEKALKRTSWSEYRD